MHLINGKEQSHISVSDRGLMYGHSVFETVRIHQRKPLLWPQHLSRLQLGCERLSLPLDIDALTKDVKTVCNNHSAENFVLRVSQTMGSGGRGYLSPKSATGSRIVSAHELPEYPKHRYLDGVTLGLCDLRLSRQPELAGIKHANRLEQIIARSQWHPSWHEALLLDYEDQVIEATQSNVFLVQDGALKTPRLEHCGVAGVMREFIIRSICGALNLSIEEAPLGVANVAAADEVFVSNSLIGLWPVREFQNRTYKNFTVSHSILKSLIEHDAIPAY